MSTTHPARPSLAGATAQRAARMSASAARWLGRSAAAWMIVALAGQLLFAAYVFAFYGSAVLGGDWSRWNRVLPHGYVAGDTAGNLVVLSHLAFTIVVVACGCIQMLAVVRRRWPRVHRISGRTYLVSALILGLGGLAMSLFRSGSEEAVRQVAGIANTLVIVAFAVLAWHTARSRRFVAHRQWALRLFMAVAGVWFFRVGLMLWLLVLQAPVGFDPETFRGPFLTFLSYAKFLLPLAFLELYFLAQAARSAAVKWSVAGTLVVLGAGTAAGIAGAASMLWLPHLR